MDFEGQRIAAYFAQLSTSVGRVDNLQIVAIAHMVSNSIHFLPSLNRIGRVALLLPKPSASESAEAETIRMYKFPEEKLSRQLSRDPDAVCALLLRHLDQRSNFVLIDIGGYFALALPAIKEKFGERFLGVMEGTENGVQKYEDRYGLENPYPVAVITVARSPLKLPEDYLVGASIVFSVEATLRTQAQILQTRIACLIGYGRVGSGVAEVLRGRGIATVVHDKSPIAMAEAAARGFQVYRRLDEALAVANLIVSATGNHALDSSAIAAVRTGSLIATVTSSDDEFGKDEPLQYFKRSLVSEEHGDLVTRYDSENDNGKYFWLVNDGKAANFAHGAVIGPAIQLIEGEKLVAIRRLADGTVAGATTERPLELNKADREMVAEIWNEHFLAD